jgi:hypothetical protein
VIFVTKGDQCDLCIIQGSIDLGDNEGSWWPKVVMVINVVLRIEGSIGWGNVMISMA